MNALQRWDPVRELEEMSDRLSSFFGRWPMRREGTRQAMTVAEWMPLVDIEEDDKEYTITAEIPQVKKNEVKVSVDDGQLSITGERKHEEEKKGKRYHRIERAYGSFARSFSLPDDADAEKVRAEFNEGTLCVHVPKNPQAQPKPHEVPIS